VQAGVGTVAIAKLSASRNAANRRDQERRLGSRSRSVNRLTIGFESRVRGSFFLSALEVAFFFVAFSKVPLRKDHKTKAFSSSFCSSRVFHERPFGVN
jgi:hypothetical protein